VIAKLALLIVTVGASCGGLLVIRQQAIDTTAEIARVQLRLDTHRKAVIRMRAEVASAVRPGELQAARERLGLEWQPIPYRFDPLRGDPDGPSGGGGHRLVARPAPAAIARGRGG